MAKTCLGILAMTGWLASAGLVAAQQSPAPTLAEGGAFCPTPQFLDNSQTAGVFGKTGPPEEPAASGAPCPAVECPADSPKEEESGETPCVSKCCWELGLEYSLIWFRKNQFPGASVTTGNPNVAVPGALGDPTTTVVSPFGYGDFPASAGKITVARWLGEGGVCRLDASYMGMEQRSALFSIASDGSLTSAFLGRPFFNPVQNREDNDPRAIPGVMAGSLNDGFVTRFQQAETNIRFYQGNECANGLTISALVGGRFVQLHERYFSADTVTDLPLGSAFAQNFLISDHFATNNDFYGAQVGLGALWHYECLSLEILGKLAAGINQETLKIGGLTTITNQNTGQTVSDTIGLFAQRSNSGTFRSHHWAYIPELNVNLAACMGDCIRFKVGYDLLSIEKVIRPGQAIDRAVNIQPLLAPAQEGVALPQPILGARTGFLMQGVTFGVELLF